MMDTSGPTHIDEQLERFGLKKGMRHTLGETVYSAEDIHNRVTALGKQISDDYRGKVPILVSVLKGAVIFVTDLARAMDIPHEMDFLAISAYAGVHDESSVQLRKDVTQPIEGRDVILVEDVIDTGLTLRFIKKWIATHNPASLKICTLLDRPHRRIVETPIHYRGFVAPDEFCVGYGFDYRQQFRNLPDIVALTNE